MMTWTALVSIIVALIALAVIVTGFNLLTGRWIIPANSQGKVSLTIVISSVLLGLLSVLLAINPSWSEALNRPLRQNR